MDDLRNLIKSKNAIDIAKYLKENDLTIKGGKIVPASDESKSKYKKLTEFYDARQQARKILLNSLYGALLNPHLLFSDDRMGKSVTMSGRCITRHMTAAINDTVYGEYTHVGLAAIYNDTDSAYFSIKKMFEGKQEPSREEYIKAYDMIADAANDSFPAFMNRFFNTSLERGAIIKAGRELVCSKMLFVKKKKYCGLIYDLEGTRYDVDNQPGKLKVMGLDLKRADTPKYMQRFLEQVVLEVLTDGRERDILDKIRAFRDEFKTKTSWEKGSPKKVANLTKYRNIMARKESLGLMGRRTKNDKKSVTIPGHVLASINYNKLCEVHNDKFAMRITDGSRIVVCKLKPNLLKMDSVAYPIDEPHLPAWFKQLPFDDAAMEEVIIDKKLNNLLAPLKWDLESTKRLSGDEFFS